MKKSPFQVIKPTAPSYAIDSQRVTTEEDLAHLPILILTPNAQGQPKLRLASWSLVTTAEVILFLEKDDQLHVTKDEDKATFTNLIIPTRRTPISVFNTWPPKILPLKDTVDYNYLLPMPEFLRLRDLGKNIRRAKTFNQVAEHTGAYQRAAAISQETDSLTNWKSPAAPTTLADSKLLTNQILWTIEEELKPIQEQVTKSCDKRSLEEAISLTATKTEIRHLSDRIDHLTDLTSGIIFIPPEDQDPTVPRPESASLIQAAASAAAGVVVDKVTKKITDAVTGGEEGMAELKAIDENVKRIELSNREIFVKLPDLNQEVETQLKELNNLIQSLQPSVAPEDGSEPPSKTTLASERTLDATHLELIRVRSYISQILPTIAKPLVPECPSRPETPPPDPVVEEELPTISNRFQEEIPEQPTTDRLPSKSDLERVIETNVRIVQLTCETNKSLLQANFMLIQISQSLNTLVNHMQMRPILPIITPLNRPCCGNC